jgi:hypothetical protein
MENRTRWEHCRVDENSVFFYRTRQRNSFPYSFEGHVATVAQLEAEGWELVAVTESTFYFKRPWEEKE